MTAKGKTNASKATVGMRIIVRAFESEFRTGTITPSATKTKDGDRVARITGKSFREANWANYERQGKYIIETTEGTFEASPIQTMILAPEDAAGIKRAHVEALEENKRIDRAATVEEIAAPAEADRLRTAVAEAKAADTDEEAAKILSAATGVFVSREQAIVIAGRPVSDEETVRALTEQVEAIADTVSGNAAAKAMGDAWQAGTITTEDFDSLNSRHAYKIAEFKAPAVGDLVEWRGERGITGRVTVASDVRVRVEWTRHASGISSNDDMPRGEFAADWRIFASADWAARAARCDNRWHGTAPVRMTMPCPHCPV